MSFFLPKRIEERNRTYLLFVLAKITEERWDLSSFFQRESKKGVGLVAFVLAKRIKERDEGLVELSSSKEHRRDE